jgi:hypothetical protein
VEKFKVAGSIFPSSYRGYPRLCCLERREINNLCRLMPSSSSSLVDTTTRRETKEIKNCFAQFARLQSEIFSASCYAVSRRRLRACPSIYKREKKSSLCNNDMQKFYFYSRKTGLPRGVSLFHIIAIYGIYGAHTKYYQIRYAS